VGDTWDFQDKYDAFLEDNTYTEHRKYCQSLQQGSKELLKKYVCARFLILQSDAN